MSEPLIIVENLSKLYRKADEYSLQDVSLTISVGDRFGIFGPNGAGKTTLISILCGIIKPTSGHVKYSFTEKNIRKNSNIGYVPQELAFYNELTAKQNLEYFGALYHLPKDVVNNRSKELLKLLGLTKVANKKVNTYSGGMKRRLNLAIAIIHNPKVLFLDEPTVGVDIQSKNAIMIFLNKLNESGTTIIYTSHHLSEAEEFCNHIAILDYGKVIAFDKIDALMKQYDSTSLMEIMLKLTGEGYRD